MTVVRVTPDGALTTIGGATTGASRNVEQTHLRDVARHPSGQLFVVDRLNSIIRRVADNGGLYTVVGQPEDTLFDGPADSVRFLQPAGLWVERDGTVLVADRGNDAIRAIKTDGGVVTRTRVRQPVEVGTDADGGLFVLSALDDAGILQFVDAVAQEYNDLKQSTLTTRVEAIAGNRAGTGLSPVFGLAVSPDGTLYARESSQLTRFDVSGARHQILALVSNERLPMTAYQDGNVYFADALNVIRKLAPNGDVRVVAGVEGQSGVHAGPALAPLGRIRGLAWYDGAIYASVSPVVVKISGIQ